ncbi:unnamed protein product [Macrosiphum euphorbiae]|uniref:Uncharacterized protein n=1 Tax=Macrosiphum euphorbiae TaxID=13131 RepID=A0AAV0Y8W4_9HEMI|nr:unnamed protein product [Macrosiphum euphorbiae]
MDSINVLKYMEKRQLGYTGIKSKLNDMFIGQMGYIPQTYDGASDYPLDDTGNTYIYIGNTFACKFSRNKNNSHLVGISTVHGEIILENTIGHYNEKNNQFQRYYVHDDSIFNFAWAEPQMKIITACRDGSSKLCSFRSSGVLDEERKFIHYSAVKSVMFCPGSSDIFCCGCQDGSIKIWDARLYNDKMVLECDHNNISNTHYSISGTKLSISKSEKCFGVSSVIFNTDQTVISCSSMDHDIKLWDLRKSYRQVQEPICQYSGHLNETGFSKISISHDGRYLFSSCKENNGVIWLTDFPYNENPMFKIDKTDETFPKLELRASDWCADPTSTKLVTSSNSMPMVWSIHGPEQKISEKYSICPTSFYQSKKS